MRIRDWSSDVCSSSLVVQAEQVGEAHTAVYLRRHAPDLARGFAQMRFRMKDGQRRVLHPALAGIAGIPDQRTAGLQHAHQFGAHVLNRLEAAYLTPELLTLVGIGDRPVDHALTRAERVGGNHQPRSEENTSELQSL